jgi:hypothetical protein
VDAVGGHLGQDFVFSISYWCATSAWHSLLMRDSVATRAGWVDSEPSAAPAASRLATRTSKLIEVAAGNAQVTQALQ